MRRVSRALTHRLVYMYCTVDSLNEYRIYIFYIHLQKAKLNHKEM